MKIVTELMVLFVDQLWFLYCRAFDDIGFLLKVQMKFVKFNRHVPLIILSRDLKHFDLLI
jgi:hypothetical protein